MSTSVDGMREVVIVGTGMTAFAKTPERSMASLSQEAADHALADAELPADQIDLVVVANAVAAEITGQASIVGQVALRDSELASTPIINVDNACASGSSAAHACWLAIASGQYDVAMALGVEKVTHPDKLRSFKALLRGTDVERWPEGALEGTPVLMGAYAREAQGYLDRTGATVDVLAEAAAKSRCNGSLNPKAQYRQEVSAEEVLASRSIAPPLTLLMCSPFSDGAAALVLCSADYAKANGLDGVRILASALGSGGNDLVERTAAIAFARSGISPSDIDVLEIHDAASSAEPIVLEEVGIAPPDEGWKLVAEGETRIGGGIPVNTSGGLVSRGHPIGATGCAQLVELSDQLRGRCGARQVEGAKVAAAQNAGGVLDWEPLRSAACVVTILGV